jgi:ribosomal protein S2
VLQFGYGFNAPNSHITSSGGLHLLAAHHEGGGSFHKLNERRLNMDKSIKLKDSLPNHEQRLITAKKLLAAGGHWGRQTRARQAPLTVIAAKRGGVDLIDLLGSAGQLMALSQCLHSMDRKDIAWAGSERLSVASLECGLAKVLAKSEDAGLVALGRWRPGTLSNRQCGAWRDVDIKALILVGSGMEIAAREAKRKGLIVAWICDTNERGQLADYTVWLNTSSKGAMDEAIGVLLT